ncbi:MAG: LuxR C-terminal-related transcriptional regulator [Janthinobacterium lividum]
MPAAPTSRRRVQPCASASASAAVAIPTAGAGRWGPRAADAAVGVAAAAGRHGGAAADAPDASGETGAFQGNARTLAHLRNVLTERRVEVLQLPSQGKPDKLIGRSLGIGEGTVKGPSGGDLAGAQRAQPDRGRAGRAIAHDRRRLSRRRPTAILAACS